MMQHHRSGEDVAIQWLCHQCHYPHHNAHMTKCINCKGKRDISKEPLNFVRSKVRIAQTAAPSTTTPAQSSPSKAPAPTAPASMNAAAAKTSGAWPAPPPPKATAPAGPNTAAPGAKDAAPGEGDAQMPAQDAAKDVPMEGTGEPATEEPATAPLFVPTCLNVHAVRALIRQGVTAVGKYKDHFQIKAAGPTELQHQLAAARRKLAGLQTLDTNLYGSFAADIETSTAEIAALEVKLGTTGEVDTASEAAPGVESGLLSKMTLILSKHQKAMAAEEQEHASLVTTLEAQASEIQAQIAEEHKMHTIRHAANQELLIALQTKAYQLGTTPAQPMQAEATAEEAKQELQAQLQHKFTPEWLEENGLGHLMEPALQVIFAQYDEVLKAAGPKVRSALHTQPEPPPTVGDKKRCVGDLERRADVGEELLEQEKPGEAAFTAASHDQPPSGPSMAQSPQA